MLRERGALPGAEFKVTPPAAAETTNGHVNGNGKVAGENGVLSPLSPAGQVVRTNHDARVAAGLVRPGSSPVEVKVTERTPVTTDARTVFAAGRDARITARRGR